MHVNIIAHNSVMLHNTTRNSFDKSSSYPEDDQLISVGWDWEGRTMPDGADFTTFTYMK